ncbi:putative protein phosphatase 2C 4 [Morella rubra]|uniref:PPM-type phosphatase domain-containing protein n=1 Tax=Morella rubra TaxID=262757 RepID=A0A6A1WGV6_9ROSI|nr:putative protein phosphatase 2C 4 [Morella rubra]
MGNGIGKGCHCLAGAGRISRSQHDIAVVLSNPLDEGLGHSFCYVRPDPPKLSSFSSHSEEDESFATTTFRSISGASVSANTSTPLSTSLLDLGGSSAVDRAASFASSTSFASIPLQPIPRCSTSGLTLASGPIERGFMSGPMERGFVSGPLDRGVYSGPIEEGRDSRTKGGRGYRSRVKSKKRSLIIIFKKVISSTIFRGHKSIVAPVKGSVNVKEPNLEKKNGNVSVSCGDTSSSTYLKDGDGEEESEYFMERENLQWAQGKAGEDRVQVVISEEHGWVFVGIYDGFNGPDATEYLVSNLYSAVHKELEDLVRNYKLWPSAATSSNPAAEGRDQSERMNFDEEDDSLGKREMDMESNSKRKHSNNSKNRSKGLGKRCEESQSRWSFEGDVERVELERKLKRQFVRWGADGAAGTDHSDVLKALSDALRKTEDCLFGDCGSDAWEKS